MFGFGPIWALLIQPRRTSRSMRPRLKRSVWATNAALLVLVGGLCWLVGWREYLLVQGIPIFLAAAAGVWLFYVQHQFEDAYWESSDQWSYADAALRGSSHLRLPKVLQYFSGNIGVHHVHHLNARIPNYNLQRAHDENPVFHDVPTLSLRDGIRATRLKLWDEERGRLVTFDEACMPPSQLDKHLDTNAFVACATTRTGSWSGRASAAAWRRCAWPRRASACSCSSAAGASPTTSCPARRGTCASTSGRRGSGCAGCCARRSSRTSR